MTTIDNHQPEEERDDDFEEFINVEKPLPVKVQKPMDEVMDAQGSYSTALRQQIGSGNVEDHDVHITVGTGGTVRVEFREDGDPTVWYSMDDLVSTAVSAAIDAGFLEDVAEAREEPEEAPDDAE